MSIDPNLYASLHQHVQAWVTLYCEDENWPEVYIGNDTVSCMTDAAYSVFRGIFEAEQFCNREGFFKS